jgi:rfaE bifunctional protein kinase chain/domain
MKVAQLSHERLAELVGRFGQARIAVLGDFFLDKYLDVDPRIADISVESVKTAHQVVAVRVSPGAAGTVMSNLAALGPGRLHAIGIIGDDGEGYDLCRSLEAIGSSTDHLHRVPRRYTPQYLKPRDRSDASLAGEHERYDTKNRTPTPPQAQQQIIDSMDKLLPDLDALVIADQIEQPNCGAVTATVRQALSERACAYPDVVFFADSRRNIGLFNHITIKPNQFEVIAREYPLPGDEVTLEELRPALEQLRTRIEAPVCATRGELGMVVSDPQWTLVPGVRVEGPTDPTGAGDSASAGMTLALCAGAELPEAAVVANLVASITVGQLATTGVARPEQLATQLTRWHEQQ